MALGPSESRYNWQRKKYEIGVMGQGERIMGISKFDKTFLERRRMTSLGEIQCRLGVSTEVHRAAGLGFVRDVRTRRGGEGERVQRDDPGRGSS